ncbi:recombinase family protein [Alicyclobacillus dauci]|uniref:Recombinase family protein n=1 Tax=Alicyclobacillus dauci TaxID=1475485 RepID=A0ABY6Z5H0_9BACL|nr:recombinase family protein [Alicyclobacillus dauci]WAH38138.1 recombinase family protein [Alicyclobacillus dauci]
MRTVAYYRSSTNLQEHSVEMQKTMAFKTAREKLLVIEDQYPDPFISARQVTMKDRPELKRLMDDIKKGRVQNLLVYKRDRLARLATEYMHIYRFLKEHQVNVIFTADNEHPLSYTAVGEFFEVLMAGVIQREGEQIAKRIRDSKISKFLAKQYAGKVPFGYHINKHVKENEVQERIVQTPGDIEIARELYDLVLSQHFESLNEIKKYFDRQELSRKVVKKGQVVKERNWEVADIYNILSNPLYMGKHIMTFEGAGEFEATYEGIAIVTVEEWEKVQELLPNMITKRERDKEKIVYHMEGLLFCSVCKEPLIAKDRMRQGVNVGMYECTHEAHNCKVRQEHVETLVLERAKTFFSTMVMANINDLIERYRSTNAERLQRQIKTLSSEIEERKNQMVKRADQYLRTSDTSKKGELTDKLLKLYEQTSTVQKEYDAFIDLLAEVEALSARPKQLADNLAEFLETMQEREPDEIRLLFRDIVACVDVSPKCIDITFKHPYVVSKDVLTDVAT